MLLHFFQKHSAPNPFGRISRFAVDIINGFIYEKERINEQKLVKQKRRIQLN